MKDSLLHVALPVWQSLRLLKRPTLGLSKREIFDAHLKLERLHLQQILTRSPVTSPIELMGYTVHFPNFRLLRVLFEEIFLHEDYYFHTDAAAPLILDGGSNIGSSILYFKKIYPSARIIGFEPMPDTFDTLQRNVATNGLRDVSVHNLALAAAPGTSTLYFDPALPGSLMVSTMSEWGSGGEFHVENAVLSSYIEGPVDLLKLDIEGAESAVLSELAASGKLREVRTLIFEYHHHLVPENDGLAEILRFLEEAGFGYNVQAKTRMPSEHGAYQNIQIYAYNKA